MKKTNIYVKLNNKDIPYEYNGMANYNDNILEFIDKINNEEYKYVFDKRVKRLVKSNNKNDIIIDFNNEEIRINENGIELYIKMKVKKYKVENNNVEIIYNVDNHDILLQIEEVKKWVTLRN